MELLVHLLQPRVIDVRVDLCRRNARMTKHLLHLPQVGPTTEQVRRKAMP